MQPSLSKDYFKLFGLPVAFDVDIKRLTEQYRVLQHTVHPDKFIGASDQERRMSMQMAARINEAFQTLKNPINRARYLLQISGVMLDNENADLGNDFLIEQMELRERFEVIRREPDSKADAEKLSDELKQNVNELQTEFKAEFDSNETGVYSGAKIAYQKMQFMERLKQEVDNYIEELP